MLTIKKIKYQLMAKSREQKYNEFIQQMSFTSESTILDVGIADKEYSPYDNYLEKKYPYQFKITALSIQGICEFSQRYPLVNTVIYEGGRFPFSDKEFSIIHSNAVIEHVGSNKEQLYFINEIARCGSQFFFSTPAKEFLFEIHTNVPIVHWFPECVFDFLVVKLGKKWAAGNYMHLLTKTSLDNLMKQSNVKNYQIKTYRLLGFPYQHIVYGTS